MSSLPPRSPHDYRPNEFVTNDFIFEGLVAWDGKNPTGLDNIAGNEGVRRRPRQRLHRHPPRRRLPLRRLPRRRHHLAASAIAAIAQC